jgi:hypothetical protein
MSFRILSATASENEIIRNDISILSDVCAVHAEHPIFEKLAT